MISTYISLIRKLLEVTFAGMRIFRYDVIRLLCAELLIREICSAVHYAASKAACGFPGLMVSLDTRVVCDAFCYTVKSLSEAIWTKKLALMLLLCTPS